MIEGLIGYGIGCGTTTFTCWRIHRRLCSRIYRHLALENEAKTLERRREAIDSGLPDELPPFVGGELVESSLFPTHPGAMALSHLSAKRSENLTKVFDTSRLSTRIDQVRVETDQTISPNEEDS